jgi:hypothetical protein
VRKAKEEREKSYEGREDMRERTCDDGHCGA